MKTSKLIITCVTTLILAALIAYATRYTYFKDGEHTMRTNRYSGQVCYIGSIVSNQKSQSATKDPSATVNPLDEIWNPKPQQPTKLGWVCR